MRPVRILTLLAALATGCSEPDVGTQQPYQGVRIDYPIYHSRLDKLDLLLVVDNSSSMADEQALLADSVSYLVGRLVAPRCLDPRGSEVGRTSQGICPKGSMEEHTPLVDLHAAVITSSLGSHGADTCAPGPSADYDHTMDEMSHLVRRGSVGGLVPTWADKGFLFWDPRQRGEPEAGESDQERFSSQLSQLVLGAGHRGCGFEAPLEAWYRFLVDPEPYARLVPTPCGEDDPGQGCRERSGIDETVLAERKDFLRPDSIVVIVMLTDESDTSVIDGGRSWRVQTAYDGPNQYHLPRGRSACLAEPMAQDCMPCDGFAAAQQDPECQKGAYTEEEDPLNLRAYRQKQRFGEDFLYPLRRYAYGLTRPKMRPELGDGEAGASARDELGYAPGFRNEDFNPLFCGEYERREDGSEDRRLCNTLSRDPRLVFLAGITGVPWQILANDPKDLKKGYRPTSQLGWRAPDFDVSDLPVPPGVTGSSCLWDQVAGRLVGSEILTDSEGRTRFNSDYLQLDLRYEPLDPLMIEAVEPREGVSAATGSELSPPDAGVMANAVNGHERDIPKRDDLQYACVFPLAEPRECAAGDDDCPCKEPGNDPLCQADDGSYGSVQYRGAAYPGRRILATLQAVELLGGNSIAASICPSSLDPAAKDYAYRPAVDAIVERVRPVLRKDCVDVELDPDSTGWVDCVLLEARKADESGCQPCLEAAGRIEPDAEVAGRLRRDPEFIENGLGCLCEIAQARPGPQLDECISCEDGMPEVDGVPVNGWCYVDLTEHPNSNWMLQGCRRTVRYVGEGYPFPGALTYLWCRGTTWH